MNAELGLGGPGRPMFSPSLQVQHARSPQETASFMRSVIAGVQGLSALRAAG